jgi:hypothetical protein
MSASAIPTISTGRVASASEVKDRVSSWPLMYCFLLDLQVFTLLQRGEHQEQGLESV